VNARFIVLEGLDGTGKTTLATALADALGAVLLSTPGEVLRPTRADVDAALQGHPLARQLFYATTVMACGDRIRRLREEGRTVVVDRYWLSTLAYTQATCAAFELAEVAVALPPAELTLMITLDESKRRRRLWVRGVTEADRLTLRGGHAGAVKVAYRALEGHPVAGRTVPLNVTGLTPAGALSAALELVFSEPEQQRLFTVSMGH